MPRTTKPTGGGKRHPLNMRTTKETRERLEDEAATNGRSLAQEVEVRLERSFEHQDLFGSLEALDLVSVVAAAMKAAGSRAAWLEGHALTTPWITSPYAYDQAAQAAVRVLEALRPPGEIEVPAPRQKPQVRKLRSRLGIFTAEDMLGIYKMSDEDREEAAGRLRRLFDHLNKEHDK
jgi:hypothetical protein